MKIKSSKLIFMEEKKKKDSSVLFNPYLNRSRNNSIDIHHTSIVQDSKNHSSSDEEPANSKVPTLKPRNPISRQTVNTKTTPMIIKDVKQKRAGFFSNFQGMLANSSSNAASKQQSSRLMTNSTSKSKFRTNNLELERNENSLIQDIKSITQVINTQRARTGLKDSARIVSARLNLSTQLDKSTTDLNSNLGSLVINKFQMYCQVILYLLFRRV